MGTPDRSCLNFEEKARRAFAFLLELGFYEVEALPTYVCFRKGDVEVDIYHGRRSFEIGAGVSAFGTRYSISEIIRAVDANVAKHFRYAAAHSPEGIVASLEELSSLMKHYGREAIEGNPEFFSILENLRKFWSEEYALDVLSSQLRPQAAEAFRQRDYSKAADLYSRIRKRLTLSENKKLRLAEKRRPKGRG